MKEITKVVVDAMGGDNAPHEIIKGAVEAVGKSDAIHVILVGKEDVINQELSGYTYNKEQISVVHTSEVIETAEPPVMAIRRKKDSSIVVGLKMVKDKEADAFVSAGSSGAVLAGGQLLVGRIKGVERPPLAPLIPTEKGFSILIDCGANVDARPSHLVQFAKMGSIYMEHVVGVENPKVAIVNIGAEEEKGRELEQETYALLKNSTLNFTGNVEARNAALGEVDVVVTDGFTGNIYLKTVEGMGKFMKASLKKIFFRNLGTKIGAMFTMKGIKEISKQMDYRETGGSPLLGTAKPVLKAHGSSDALAFKNAVRQAKDFVERNVIAEMEKVLSENTEG